MHDARLAAAQRWPLVPKPPHGTQRPLLHVRIVGGTAVLEQVA